jgi:hypothetical protein
MCEQQALRLASDRSCGPYNRPKMFAAGQRTKVFQADPCEVGNFVFGKSLLIGLYGNHFSCRPLRFLKTLEHLKTGSKVDRYYFPSNHSAVRGIAAAWHGL